MANTDNDIENANFKPHKTMNSNNLQIAVESTSAN